MTRRRVITGAAMSLLGLSVGCAKALPAQTLDEAAWQLYIMTEHPRGTFSCARCAVMQNAGSVMFWVEDSVKVGDSLSSVRDRSESHNQFGSGWCAKCFSKLIRSGGQMPMPKRNPPPPPPTKEEIQARDKAQEKAQREAFAFQVRREREQADLYWALRTRPLTEAEMAAVRQQDYMLIVPFGVSYNVSEKRAEFNAALEQQYRIRLAAKTAKE